MFKTSLIGAKIAIKCETKEELNHLIKWSRSLVIYSENNNILKILNVTKQDNLSISITSDYQLHYSYSNYYNNELFQVINFQDALLEIPTGTIVKATRYCLSNEKNNYVWQGVYFGFCNNVHLVDNNNTHCMIANEVEVLKTYSKKEAKQLISQLFSNSKAPTSQKIRDIIDLIEL